MNHAILAEGLVRRFGDTTALSGVDLAARTGTVLGLLGPNGAGKTTAVRILATLLTPDAGYARVCGYDVVRQAHQVRRQIGLTGQYASVDEALTGAENLILIGRLLGLPRPEARATARRLLADFHLDDAGDRAAKTYSGGMRRRLDLAASLVGRPRVLFLDEPTTGLDPRGRTELWEVVRTMVTGGVTVLLTTQYLDEADALADEIAVVDHGRVIASGTPAQLKARMGGQVLHVRPVDPADRDTVARILSGVTGHRTDGAGPDGSASAPVADPGTMPAAVRALDDAGVAVAELALRSATLDEVFLSLTGRPATGTGDAGAPTDTGGDRMPDGRDDYERTMA
jgi:oleandomycin transport system ATP-binding protein